MKRITLFLLIVVGCSFPKDPEDSFNKTKEQGLKVGVINNPPYSYYKEGKAYGKEVKLIERFTKKEGLKINYISGSESTLVEKLKNYNINVVIGGFDNKTVWKEKAGLTTNYNNNENCFLISKGENKLLFKLDSFLTQYREDGN
ncbi:hypothetical protein GCM10007424_15360 [Flavobacterium suaedae]|uniref:Solute-binding protein family 3/N-terminal domain-containing protein n=1 Tax=Flavobacterium suaedae TaxID=1767027 RepID=A0ABQ1JSA6_9FLAO|nr:transporter substrate-binding domain-containing protein [Flavobacterium suaedae]GGB76280.1 hypothetical protein GCM10007424_15360 [Flavobacterium suaedae]